MHPDQIIAAVSLHFGTTSRVMVDHSPVNVSAKYAMQAAVFLIREQCEEETLKTIGDLFGTTVSIIESKSNAAQVSMQDPTFIAHLNEIDRILWPAHTGKKRTTVLIKRIIIEQKRPS